jgi:hypothetical protein
LTPLWQRAWDTSLLEAFRPKTEYHENVVK